MNRSAVQGGRWDCVGGRSRADATHPSVRSAAKRIVDRTLATLALFLLSPVFAAVALLIYLTSGQPVLFRQVRSGYRMTPFVIYKFRTMREASGADGQPLPDAERLTKWGRWLRKSSLDELPQLWNVIRGELSLVGPRPQILKCLSLYTLEQVRRHDVRPGITGWAQVNGRNAIGWEETFRYDLWYIDHWSLRLDARILLLTVVKVLRCEGTNEREMLSTATPAHSTIAEGSGTSNTRNR